MSKASLKTVHRLLLLNVLNAEGKAGGFSLSELKDMLEMMKVIELSENEKTSLNLRAEDNQIRWDLEKDAEKEVEFSEDQKELLKRIFKKLNDNKSFNLDNLNPMLELVGLLGIGL